MTMTENEKRLDILRQASVILPGRGLGWPSDLVANQIAVELIETGLVVGTVQSSGMGYITGIRSAGLEYLEGQKPHRRFLGVVWRGVKLVSFPLGCVVGYVLSLDSVRKFFSDLVERVLK